MDSRAAYRRSVLRLRIAAAYRRFSTSRQLRGKAPRRRKRKPQPRSLL